ncbi:MAG TPA: hypothetical protein VNF99_22560 [Stellaceae bacterium]|nr:hypothetical protein [Stellaceae bacterium]
MKTLTYAAAIALLTASAAFAQSSSTNAGSSGTMQNLSGSGQTMQDQNQPGQSMSDHSTSSRPTDIKGSMTRPDNKSSPQAARGMSGSRDMSKAAPHRMARADMKSDRSQDAQENQTTMELNRQQLSGMHANGSSAMSGSGMSGMNRNGNSFDNDRPQSASSPSAQ